MAGLTVAHRMALSTLLERAPDAMLNSLSMAVQGLSGDRAEELRIMLARQLLDRRRRALVLGPLIPMFRPRADGVRAVTWPAGVLGRLWEVAGAREPELLPSLDDADGPMVVPVSDRICLTAATIVRDTPELIWPVDDAPERRLTGLNDLAVSLDLVPVLRKRISSLQAWVKRPDEDQLAELRLLLRDCTAVHPDGARRALDVLFAHLDDAVLVLRIIALTAGGAGRERFVQSSEMAGFVDDLLVQVRVRVARIVAFRPGEGQVDDLIDDLKWCAAALTEVDVTLDPSRGGQWGEESRACRKALDSRLAALLRATNQAVAKGFAMEKVAITGQMTRPQPLLSAPADGPAPRLAVDLLKIVGALRGPAAVFGVEADRAGAVEILTIKLTDWADQAMSEVNDDGVEDLPNALRLVSMAADGLEALGRGGAASTVRRRVAVARMRQPKAEVSSEAA
ncbi:hypothetical protein ACIQC9_09945 [Brevundimonas sp. NPDC092305]|uniref:hypothetical protein n=1 Tax=Brevundimonas sp. NPDC092305 TaxID=3363957 RepID=UPI00382C63BD